MPVEIPGIDGVLVFIALAGVRCSATDARRAYELTQDARASRRAADVGALLAVADDATRRILVEFVVKSEARRAADGPSLGEWVLRILGRRS